jgi:hypothetical protein
MIHAFTCCKLGNGKIPRENDKVVKRLLFAQLAQPVWCLRNARKRILRHRTKFRPRIDIKVARYSRAGWRAMMDRGAADAPRHSSAETPGRKNLGRKASETDFSGSLRRVQCAGKRRNVPVETNARKRVPFRARRLCISALPGGSAAALYRSTVSCSNYP